MILLLPEKKLEIIVLAIFLSAIWATMTNSALSNITASLSAVLSYFEQLSCFCHWRWLEMFCDNL